MVSSRRNMALSDFITIVKLSAVAVLLTCLCKEGNAAIYDLYNTKIATSDLRWTTEPRNSWEEVSGFDRFGSVIRSYQVCQLGKREKNNWLRSPFIKVRGAQRVNVEIEFSIAKCDWPGMDVDYCRQTFNLFYYENERDVASSTFPPWQERPYIKVDTVAANSNNDINKKTFAIGPLKGEGGIYIAAQDQGACMSLISLRVYYYYCPETIHSLATYPHTMTGSKTASLVTVIGTCVDNSEIIDGNVPKYYCGSTGEWQISTGSCWCKGGYQPHRDATACRACPPGTFKSTPGNGKCVDCPANSGLLPESAQKTWDDAMTLVESGAAIHAACPCYPGFARAPGERTGVPCTKIPSAPLPGTITTNSTSVEISWEEPEDLGNRDDLFYSIQCEYCSAKKAPCQKCPETVSYLIPSVTSLDGFDAVPVGAALSGSNITVTYLEPFTRYVFKIFSHNGVSESSNVEPAFLLAEVVTPEAVPPPVSNIYVADYSTDTVVIKWRKPINPRGKILGYEVEILPRKQTQRAQVEDANVHSQMQLSGMKSRIVETTSPGVTLDALAPNTEYVLRIRAKSAIGFGEYSRAVTFQTSKNEKAGMVKSEGDNGTGFLIAAVSAVLVLAVGCSVLVFVYSRRKGYSTDSAAEKKFPRTVSTGSNRYDEVAERKKSLARECSRNYQSDMEKGQKMYVDYPDPQRAVQRMNKEVSPLNLRLHNTIGEGEFAVAYRATLLEGCETETVAAKQLKQGASVKEQANFLREACTMAQFDHPNILQLKGVITKHKPVMIISEYMENGSLDQLLQRHRGQLVMPQMLHMLIGIANGMRYLSQMQYVHRDLAARNILVSSDLVCKVSDFGLSRVLENDPHATYTTQGGKIALRWTAPESIRFREFTSASDVWSFGIMMWEVMSYGEKPYWDMTNKEVVQSIGNGMRLPAPTNCPKSLHELMLECWSLDPQKRPTFAKIVTDLNRFIRHSSLLQVQPEDQMDQNVFCTPESRHGTYQGNQERESLFNVTRMSDEDFPESESSSLSQEDTCSSVVIADERCLNV